MTGVVCNDNRFILLKKYKNKLIESTNIETANDEMAVIDSILFRFWQMGWLDKLENFDRQKAEIERLNEKYSRMKFNLESVLAERADHTEAIKEFAERLKSYFNDGKDVMYLQTIIHYGIDKIAKEMEGESK